MRAKNFVSAALVAAVVALASVVVLTYDDDTHYSLTYYMARSCGFTPLQAYRIASADVAIDSDKNTLTEPVQKERMRRILDGRQPGETTLYGSWQRNSTLGSALDAAEPRVRFHAFRDLRVTKDGAAADAAVIAREAGLWQLAIAEQNPGVFLHFVQDGPAHRGYWAPGGHWYQSIEGADQSALVYGANTDFLSHDANHNRQMIQRTVLSLRLFMTTMTQLQRLGSGCDPGAIQPLVERLIAANPEPSAPTKVQMANKAFNMFEGAPNADRADYEVLSALHAHGDLSVYRTNRQRQQFTYNSSAHASDINGISTYGTLTVQVNGASKNPSVSIWTVPSGFGEVSYQLQCKAGSSRPRFDKMPVGDLMVQTVANGKVTRSKVTLNGLTGLATVDAPAETQTEAADECQQQAAKTAEELCPALPGKVPAPDPKKEQELNQKMDECRQKENEPIRSEPEPTPAPRLPPPPPPKPAPPPQKSGLSFVQKGLLIYGGLSVLGATVAVLEGAKTSDTTPGPTPTPTPGGSCSVVSTPAIQCVRVGSGGNCTDTIMLNIGVAIASGTAFVRSTPSLFVGGPVSVSPGSVPGNRTISISHAYTVCPPSQIQIAVFDGFDFVNQVCLIATNISANCQ